MMETPSAPAPKSPFITTIKGVSFYCDQFGSVSSRGIWYGNPLPFVLPHLMLHLGLAILFSGTWRHLLGGSLKQPRFVTDLMGGIILGPSAIGFMSKIYDSLYPPKSMILIDVLEMLAFMFLAFIVGVRTDFGILKKAGRLGIIIGIGVFLVPLVMTLIVATFLASKVETNLKDILPVMAPLVSGSSFHVISLLLEDLKLLNSELGRLALSSSMISGILSFFTSIIFMSTRSITASGFRSPVLPAELGRIFMVIIIIFGIRRLVLWMMRKIPEGEPLKESYLIGTTVMILIVAFVSECTGSQAMFGTAVLGLAVPAGPPLGSGIQHKLDYFVAAMLLPAYIVNVGIHIDVFVVKPSTFGYVELIILVATLGKIVASVIPALYYKYPFKDALSLGLILSSQGLFDVLFFSRLLKFKIIDPECHTIMTLMAAVHSAIFTPLVSYLYDPSKRYINYRRRTIQHSRPNSEFRILACIHEEDDLHHIMDVLEVSNPTRESPLGIFVLDLVELVARADTLIINHNLHEKHSSRSTRTQRIINAFRRYEHRFDGLAKVNCFTAMTPYVSMHDDICSLALEKSTSLLIVPYHKFDKLAIRAVNKNVLNKAPCSVGLLVDKGIASIWRSRAEKHVMFHVCVVFLGGPDYREALAYAMRMVENPSIKLTVVRLVASVNYVTDLTEARLDVKAISKLRMFGRENHERIRYMEHSVQDGVETSQVLLSLNDDYHLIMVGRRHDNESPLLTGLTDWTDSEELGAIGDMLASSDMKSNAAVLVLQQQASVEANNFCNNGNYITSIKYDHMTSHGHIDRKSSRVHDQLAISSV